MKRNKTRYRIGTWNLLYGRGRIDVKKEVIYACNEYKLDVLITQEAADYVTQLSNIEGFNYFVDRQHDRSAKQVGILVKSSLTVDRTQFKSVGDGWRTVKGDWHGPVPVPKVRINKELQVKGLHAPTPSEWRNGKLYAPSEREDDYKALATHTEMFLRGKGNSVRVAGGDWNEPPRTEGNMTPRDIARVSKSHLVYPTNSNAGHGNIDYFIVNGVNGPDIIRCTKDIHLDEGSDHQLVVMVIMV